MKYLLKYSPEITIKSRFVRNRFSRQLRKNLAKLLHRLSSDIVIEGTWDYMEIHVPPVPNRQDDELHERVEELLLATPGICFFQRVRKYPLIDLPDVADKALAAWKDRLTGKTFAVRCRRSGRHPFNSMEVERVVGEALRRRAGAAGVDLAHPQELLRLEIQDQSLFIVEERQPGLGGFPLGTQGEVLSLVSGGYDSAVSSYLAMKRGLITHYCFFNLGGREHEIAVKEVALYLWLHFGASHGVKFVTVQFEEVVREILSKVENSQMGVVLKRMMLRAATRIAEKLELEAMVTGESVAQVSSQTLPNLAVIDKASDLLVLRPLAMAEKRDIIDMARAIGTEQFSAVIPEYCGIISVKPTTRARLPRIEKEESRFDFAILRKAAEECEILAIDRMELRGQGESRSWDIQASPAADAVVIDIRHPEEERRNPLRLSGNAVERMPFFKLNSAFASLNADTRYLLYCDKGIMSRLHASYLRERGFANVGVYRPDWRTDSQNDPGT